MKIIFIVAFLVVLAFGAMVYFALAPVIKDMSAIEPFRQFVNVPLTIKRDALVSSCDAADTKFKRFVLHEQDAGACRRLYSVRSGTRVRITAFKSFKGSASGFTHVYALMEIDTPERTMEVEYDWGSTDLAELSQGDQALPLAVWQDPDDSRVQIEKD